MSTTTSTTSTSTAAEQKMKTCPSCETELRPHVFSSYDDDDNETVHDTCTLCRKSTKELAADVRHFRECLSSEIDNGGEWRKLAIDMRKSLDRSTAEIKKVTAERVQLRGERNMLLSRVAELERENKKLGNDLCDAEAYSQSLEEDVDRMEGKVRCHDQWCDHRKAAG